jgi:hypothetical protein
MKKIILLIFITSLTSCAFFFQLSSDKELTEKINSEYEKEQKPIDLSKLTNFDWDNYIVIGCYENVEQVGKKYKIDLSNISENAISSSDWFILLVFIKDKKSIKICEVKMETRFNENKLLKAN